MAVVPVDAVEQLRLVGALDGAGRERRAREEVVAAGTGQPEGALIVGGLDRRRTEVAVEASLERLEGDRSAERAGPMARYGSRPGVCRP